MKTTIDQAGRVVIPAEVRRRAGLRAGAELEVTVADDSSVRLVRLVVGPRLQRAGRRLVARPTAPAGERSEVDVAALVAEERNRSPW